MDKHQNPIRLSAKEYLILDHLRSGKAMYGLELVKASGGELKRGTIYVTLNRMIDKGLAKDEVEEVISQPGMPRRLYSTTGFGQTCFAAENTIRQVLGGSYA